MRLQTNEFTIMPVRLNCACDAVRLHAPAHAEGCDQKLNYEQCEPAEAERFGLYRRLADGRDMHVHDYASQELAQQSIADLHLRQWEIADADATETILMRGGWTDLLTYGFFQENEIKEAMVLAMPIGDTLRYGVMQIKRLADVEINVQWPVLIRSNLRGYIASGEFLAFTYAPYAARVFSTFESIGACVRSFPYCDDSEGVICVPVKDAPVFVPRKPTTEPNLGQV